MIAPKAIISSNSYFPSKQASFNSDISMVLGLIELSILDAISFIIFSNLTISSSLEIFLLSESFNKTRTLRSFLPTLPLLSLFGKSASFSGGNSSMPTIYLSNFFKTSFLNKSNVFFNLSILFFISGEIFISRGIFILEVGTFFLFFFSEALFLTMLIKTP